MRQVLKDNGLALGFLALFLGSLVGQAFVGLADFNQQQVAHQDPTVSLGRYVTSSAFLVDVMENWQSEYLQFTLFILGTVWLVQRGSGESKPVEEAGPESDEEQRLGAHARPDSPDLAKVGGLRTHLYSNSLLIVMVLVFLGSWAAQLVTGRVEYNAQQLDHQQAPVSLLEYAAQPDFWSRTLQNWQSEFVAIASMVLFSIWLRQRGSPESKAVGAPDDRSGPGG